MAYNRYAKRQTPKAPSVLDRVIAPIESYNLSEFQTAIIEWVRNGEGNLTIVATAGSGKTFTLARVSEVIRRWFPNATARYLVFGSQNAQEAKDKFAIEASTFHSLCNRAVTSFLKARLKGRYIPTVATNVHNVIDGLFGKQHDDVRGAIASIVSKVKAENLAVNPSDNDLDFIVDQYMIDWESNEYTPSDVYSFVRQVLADTVNVDSIGRRGQIDFDDQLWLVEQFNLRLDTFDWILVDESQDTSQIRRAILHRVMHPTSRLIVVGDHDQAIYAFAGASNDALHLLTEEFSCATLPLSESYRCSQAVVRLAQRYGTITAHPSNIEGSVNYPEKVTYQDVARNELILCRTTAPLVQLAYRMIARRMPVVMRGRDIGKGLQTLVVKLAGKRGTLDTLPDKIAVYRQKETERALAKRNDNLVISVNDKCDSVLALLDSMTEEEISRGIAGVLDSIATLFDLNSKTYKEAEPTPGRPCLSTMHKAKGLEATNVAILDWQLTPHKMAKRADQQLQERHVQFVAVTRCKDALTFITTKQLAEAQ